MKIISSCLLVILVGWLLPVQSQAGDVKIDFEQYTLDNGLDVILHQDNSTPIVAVSIMYNVGSKDEEPDRTGFAHFFEHLMFEGTKHIDRGEYFQLIQDAGGQVNANTSFDRTFYFQVLPSNQLELALWMESERLLHPIIDEAGLETQRDVIIEEKNQTLDNQPYGNMLEQVFLNAYNEHPYQWVPIGAEQDIYEAGLDDFESFFNSFYVPENAVLSIAGDIDIDETKAMIERYFGDIPAAENEVPRIDIEEPPLGGEVRDTIYDNVQLPAPVMSYRIPKRGTEDYYAVEILSHILSTGNSSRLQKKLVLEEQVAADAGSFVIGLEDPGQMIIFGMANQGIGPDVVEENIQDIIDDLKENEIEERELEKVMNQIQSQRIQQFSNMQNIAQSLADLHMFEGDAGLINEQMANYRNITPEDIKRVANEVFQNDNRVVLYYLPEGAQ